MIGKIILFLVAAALLAFAGVAVYAAVLMIRRPPRALYKARTREPDLYRCHRYPNDRFN